ncbi:hypothetical protein PTQ27_02955 [Mannheimia sp. AT1]|uniref:Lipoprotein n=1 Tax=Mannheimia cairinae TaxID=3025936 RepID=A0ABT5MMV9_9PAST|nr:hypothetical protein [Mannheimia cairinae]MDD0823430.1 hypothetical protein [Mannheimia cairinae]MDD0826962.1 hypothetical protein [Mannheimia cairinae]
MRNLVKILSIISISFVLSGCLVTSVVSGVVGTAVNVVDAVTPDIID